MSVRIGRVMGVPIELHAGCIIALIVLSCSIGMGFIGKVHEGMSAPYAILAGGVAAVLLFACLVAHEFAHVIAARRCGIGTGAVSLFLFGGAAHLSRDPDEWRHELGISIAGPLVSLGLAALLLAGYFLTDRLTLTSTLIFYLAFANGVLGVANLLPGYPLDGGRVLKAVLWRVLNSRRAATRVATIMGQCIGLGIAACGVVSLLGRDLGGLWLVGLGWFVADAAARAWEQEQVREVLEHSTAAEIVTDHPTVPYPHHAIRRVSEIMSSTDDVIIVDRMDNAWDVAERVGELHDNGAAVVVDGRSLIGVVEKRELPGLMTARLRAMAH